MGSPFRHSVSKTRVNVLNAQPILRDYFEWMGWCGHATHYAMMRSVNAEWMALM
jgi:hypothetical protein